MKEHIGMIDVFFNLIMIASPHIVAGASLVIFCLRKSKNNLLIYPQAFALGILSHVLLDAIPHSEYYDMGAKNLIFWAIVDSLLALIFLAPWVVTRFYRLRATCLLVFGIGGAALPDIRFVPGFVGNNLLSNFMDTWHTWFHSSVHPTLFWGTLPQIAVIVISLGYLIKSRNNL